MSEAISQSVNLMRKPMLPPPDEGPVQMSPFSDERWDIDVEENRRRKEIHRNYVYNNAAYKKNQKHYPTPYEEPPKTTSSPREASKEPADQSSGDQLRPFEIKKKEVYKPKTWEDIKFESPRPPDLYPLFKFPERRKPENVYSQFTTKPDPVVISIPGKPSKLQESSYDPPPLPQFSSIPRIEHYGANLPFWDFSVKPYNK